MPVLGICYGMQTMAQQLGGRVTAAKHREFGYAQVTHARQAVAAATACSDHNDARGRPLLDVWMSHGDRVERCRRASRPRRSHSDMPLAAMADENAQVLRRAVPSGSHAHAAGRADPRALRARDLRLRSALGRGQHHRRRIARVREQVGKGKVLLGLSGGVDSSVVAALLHRAIGEQLMCVFVDHGLLRLGEGDQVMETLRAAHGRASVIRVNAEDAFPRRRCKGETDPERKRKIIGRLFIEVFEEEAQKLQGVDWLAQGTIYPDVIESAGSAHRQGARHQVASQRRRPAGADAPEAARAAARAVQGRSAPDRGRARPAARDGVSPSVPRSRPRRAHPRRGDASRTRICCARRTRSSSRNCAATISTTASARRSRCSCRCGRSP